MRIDLWRNRRCGSEFDTGAACKFLQRLPELDVLHSHIEGKGVTTLAAAEAVEVAGVWEDNEGGGLFLMERSQSLVGSPGFLQLNVLRDELNDLRPLVYFRNGIPGHLRSVLWVLPARCGGENRSVPAADAERT